MSKILLLLIVVLLLQTSISAEVKFAGQNENQQERTIQSLLLGINSDNFGLRTSAANMLGELKCEKAVIPLMRMLKSEDRESARIVAALALLKIGNEKGIFAIKQAIRFDDSKRVRRLCANFYNEYLQKSTAVDFLANR